MRYFKYIRANRVTTMDSVIMGDRQFKIASIIDGYKTVRKIVLDAPGPKSQRTSTYKLDALVRVACEGVEA